MSGASGDPAGWSSRRPAQPEQELTRLSRRIATSSKQGRRWQTSTGSAHHILDPRTGRPAEGTVAAVTVIAAEAWWAEVQATSLFLQGPDGLEQADDTIEALVVLDDGTQLATPGMGAVLR